jgi:hypothetical protein
VIRLAPAMPDGPSGELDDGARPVRLAGERNCPGTPKKPLDSRRLVNFNESHARDPCCLPRS